MAIKIENKTVGDGDPCFVVAEIGCNHDGKLLQAKRMIDMAADAGCDAVKFQSFSASKLFNKHYNYERKGWMDLLRGLEMPKEWLFELPDYCQKKGIIFFSSACDEEKVDWLDEIGAPVFKVPSYEMTHLSLLKYIAKKNKPIILASGISVEKEIEEAINTIYQEGNKDVVLMHCVSAYPSNLEELNLKTIPYYKEKFNIPVGLSDHCQWLLSSAAAVALGGNIVEKHITIDKKLPGPDHHFALDEKEMAQWVKEIRNMEKALGEIKKEPAPGEKNEIYWRRAIWAKENIFAGEILGKEMIMIVRPSPAGSLEPKRIYDILGKKTKREIKKGELITWDNLE